jgi:uncharacterized protein (TIGR03083 family)
MTDAEPVVGQLGEVWASIIDACEHLPARSWDLLTDCPGWSVKDQLSHLIGIERMIMGDPAPPAPGAFPGYVGNDIGRLNEAWVDSRRPASGPEVLAEFVEVTNRRIDAFTAMSVSEFDQVGWSALGQIPFRDFMRTRILDSWAHEQDIRRAVGGPGGRNGIGEKTTIDRCETTMPYIVGKRVAPPEGTSVLFTIAGPLGRRFSVVVREGRARLDSAVDSIPTTALTFDQEAFWLLGLGRASASDLQIAGRIGIEGDEKIGQDVIVAMAFIP